MVGFRACALPYHTPHSPFCSSVLASYRALHHIHIDNVYVPPQPIFAAATIDYNIITDKCYSDLAMHKANDIKTKCCVTLALE